MSDRERSAALERAIRWLSVERQERPGAKLHVLVEEAARRFDLSPRDEEFLLAEFGKGAKPPAPA